MKAPNSTSSFDGLKKHFPSQKFSCFQISVLKLQTLSKKAEQRGLQIKTLNLMNGKTPASNALCQRK